MDAVKFPGHTIVIAESQPEYHPLPAHVAADGTFTFCWKFTPDEILRIVETGMLWHQVMTFGHRLQPQLLSVERPATCPEDGS